MLREGVPFGVARQMEKEAGLGEGRGVVVGVALGTEEDRFTSEGECRNRLSCWEALANEVQHPNNRTYLVLSIFREARPSPELFLATGK